MGPSPEKYADFKVSILLYSETIIWDTEKICSICLDIKEWILKLKPSKSGIPDKFSWLGTKNGEYSTRSVYYTEVSQPAVFPQEANIFS